MHIGQIADIAAHHDVALVFDRARLAAIAHAQIALAAVGAEGREDDPRTLVHQAAGEFGEFAIITDQHADRAAIGLDHVDAVAALDVPPIAFVRRGVDLLLLVDRAVAQEDIGDILDVAVFRAGGVGAADDVDVVAHRHAREFLADLRRPFGQDLDGFLRAGFLLLAGQQHEREQFGEDHEIAFIIGRNVHEIFDIPEEILEILHRARLQLHGGQAHLLHIARHAEFLGAVMVHIRVLPHHVGGERLAGLVLGQIVFQHADRLEPVGHLKADDLIADLLGLHLLQIIVRAFHLLGAQRAGITGHARAKQDAAQFQPFGQRTALFIEALADAGAARLGIDAHFIAIEPVACRIVARAKTVAADLFPIMRLQGDGARNAGGGAIAHRLIVQNGHEIAFAEIVDLPAQFSMRIGRHVLVHAPDQVSDGRNVGDLGLTDFKAGFGGIGHGRMPSEMRRSRSFRYNASWKKGVRQVRDLI